MIRILHVIEATTGGTRLHLRQLAENLDRARFELTLACSSERDPLFLGDVASFREAGLVVLDVPMEPRVRPLADFRAFFGLCRVMWANDFHIVHTHSSKAGALGRVAAKLCSGARIVHTPHCFAFLHEPGRARAAKALWVGCERLLGLLTDRLVVVSAQERQAAIRHRIVARDRLALLHNGVEPELHPDVDRGARILRRWGVGPGARLIGTAGLLSPAKGQAHLIDALPRVLAEFPDLYCLIAGQGELLAELEDRARRAGIASRVMFTGHVEPWVDLLAALEVFVLPSLWEGMPYAVLEAMTLGKPVIATRVGGCPEAVQHGETGLLVEPGDAGGLTQALLDLLRDPARGACMGQRGRERARDLFGLQRMISALEDLYQELASGPRRARAYAARVDA